MTLHTYSLVKDYYTRRELLHVLQDTEQAHFLRCRIELVEQQLADRILLKARPCAAANLTIELHTLQEQLIKVRTQF